MKRSILFTFFFFLCSQAWCQINLKYRVIKDSLFIPWELIYGPDNHIWFTQKNGYICRMDTSGQHTDTLFHEPATVTLGESGMLGMALHPDFDNYPYVYVVWEYLNPDSAVRERVERYTYSKTANTLTPSLILLDSIAGFRYHNGCRLMIVDDKMFISVADATNIGNPQDLNSINGKILRINLDGSIPPDNPLPGKPIWSWGHRNPQGFVYAHGIFYSSEHGPDSDDELNIIRKGGNYGWPMVLGYCDTPRELSFCSDYHVVEPLHAWTPTIAPCGIDYYDHPMFPTLQNSILMTTLKGQHLYQLQLTDTYDNIASISIIDSIKFGRLRDLCISPEGKIYISTSNSKSDNTGPHIDRIVEITNPVPNGAEQHLLAYPNPCSNTLYLSVPVAFKQLHYILYSSNGTKAGEGNAYTERPHISVSNLASGLYHIAAYTDNGGYLTASFWKR